MKRPNILFLMVDQMQGQVLDPDHPCRTPNLDRLAAAGVRFSRSYTPNAVCSPARASLMTGLLPHNHGVLWVTHTVDDDQGQLRTDRPHWAQQLSAAGYLTGYFGKWHVEHSERPSDFGWQLDGSNRSELMRHHVAGYPAESNYIRARYHDPIPGYESQLHYAVTAVPPEDRPLGQVTSIAADWLDDRLQNSDEPWCCFVSLTEPHDPFVAGKEAYDRYDVDALELPPNAYDDLVDRPDLYRKAARQWRGLSSRERKEAMACYYASITELDRLFADLVQRVEDAGQLDNTVVVFTADHGELLGSHGMYCKNIMAAEEIYNIPLIITGPGVAQDQTTSARVGLQDVGTTLLELAGLDGLQRIDGQSFRSVLQSPREHEDEFDDGYAEYNGGRYLLTQRVFWDGDWKLVFNGFADDELYNLADDPFELTNLAADPAYADQLTTMLTRLWARVRDTGDRSLLDTHYPQLRLEPRGPLPPTDQS